jgi:hypothetical protein
MAKRRMSRTMLAGIDTAARKAAAARKEKSDEKKVACRTE